MSTFTKDQVPLHSPFTFAPEGLSMHSWFVRCRLRSSIRSSFSTSARWWCLSTSYPCYRWKTSSTTQSRSSTRQSYLHASRACSCSRTMSVIRKFAIIWDRKCSTSSHSMSSATLSFFWSHLQGSCIEAYATGGSRESSDKQWNWSSNSACKRPAFVSFAKSWAQWLLTITSQIVMQHFSSKNCSRAPLRVLLAIP